MRKLLFAALILSILLVNSALAQDETAEASPEPTAEVTSAPIIEPTDEATPAPTAESSPEAITESTESAPEATAESTVPPGALLSFPGPGSYTVRQPYNDIERSYRVYIPVSYSDEGDPVPLVLVLHGAGGTGAGTESFTGFNDLAETENFIVIYPDGVNNGWNDGRPGSESVNDVRFLGDVVTFVQDSLNIDPQRVYATGYSMGGMMAYRLGCELPNRFAAVGSVASTMPLYQLTLCADTFPIPVIVFQGTDDNVIPWTGVTGGYLSTAQTIGYWANHNACTGDVSVEMMPDTLTPPDDYTLAARHEVAECAADVVVYGVYFGGHTWPGHPFTGAQLGQTTLDIDATALTWEFFEAHPLPEREDE